MRPHHRRQRITAVTSKAFAPVYGTLVTLSNRRPLEHVSIFAGRANMFAATLLPRDGTSEFDTPLHPHSSKSLLGTVHPSWGLLPSLAVYSGQGVTVSWDA